MGNLKSGTKVITNLQLLTDIDFAKKGSLNYLLMMLIKNIVADPQLRETSIYSLPQNLDWVKVKI